MRTFAALVRTLAAWTLFPVSATSIVRWSSHRKRIMKSMPTGESHRSLIGHLQHMDKGFDGTKFRVRNND